MGNELLERMHKRILKLPIKLESQETVVGRVALSHHVDISPLSEDSWIFCHLEEIILGSKRERNGINFITNYSLKYRQGLVNTGYEYCLNEMIATNAVILDCNRQGGYQLKASKRSKYIYWLSYSKEYLEKGIDLTLFYLEEFGFQWIESFKNEFLSFTLVKNT